jgi:hypothetical protein
LDKAFSQVLLHEICDCTWDFKLKAVISPSAQSDMSAVAEFQQQDWVKLLSQDSGRRQPMNAHVNPNVAFPFQDNFSIGTIHGSNQKTSTPGTAAAQMAAKVVEIQEDEDNVSVLTANTSSKVLTDVAVGSRFASSSNPVSGPTSVSTQPEAASRGSEDPASDGPAGRAVGGPRGK